MGHQELPALRGQDGLHSRRRNLHGPGQGPPLTPPRISRQCCPLSPGELAGHQQEPHAVHGPLLQLRHALPHAEERAGSPGRGHRHAKPQALPQGTRQEADRTWPVRIPVPGSSVCHRLEGPQAHPLPEQLPRPEESVHREQACGGPAREVDRATACGGLHQVSLPPVSFHMLLHECSACGYSNFDSRFRYMGAVDKNDQIARLNKTRRHYRWPHRLFMKFLIWAACNAMPTSSWIPTDLTAVLRREARAQQSDLLRLQGVGQHHPERSPAATGNNLCVVCCAKYNKYLKKHPATAYGNMPHKRRKTTFWCSTCHKYLCLRVGSTCWSDYHTKVQFWR